MRQLALHEMSRAEASPTPTPQTQLRLLNWNIRNPSLPRARKQADWLIQTGANVIILTEAKYSQGCRFLSDWLTSYGFTLFFPQPPTTDYCVIVAIKDLPYEQVELDTPFLSHRLVSLHCETVIGNVHIIGTYVPSRGPKERRNEDKRQFQTQTIQALRNMPRSIDGSQIILAGDLNVIERKHIPHHTVFGEWEYEFYETFTQNGWMDAYRHLHPDSLEYSWFGRKEEGYRFDHIFLSDGLSPYLTECEYTHEVRLSGLSDHSAMFLTLLPSNPGS